MPTTHCLFAGGGFNIGTAHSHWCPSGSTVTQKAKLVWMTWKVAVFESMLMQSKYNQRFQGWFCASDPLPHLSTGIQHQRCSFSKHKLASDLEGCIPWNTCYCNLNEIRKTLHPTLRSFRDSTSELLILIDMQTEEVTVVQNTNWFLARKVAVSLTHESLFTEFHPEGSA